MPDVRPSQKRLVSSGGRGVSPARSRLRAGAGGGASPAPLRASPPAGSVSRATPSIALSPAPLGSPTAPAPEPASQQRRRTPTRARPAGDQQQQQQLETPVRSASHSVMTPASAELSGNRLHGQAREARERLDRRRNEGTSPLSMTPGPSSVTAAAAAAPAGGATVVVMTPASAEQSGNRLHEQAREARERLERRRKENTSPLSASSGLSPYTPRRWSNPRRGNPSVGGVDRLESLYLDAVQRSSKLEIARRNEDERPRNCTFTPEISKRALSRGRAASRGRRGDGGGDSDGGKGGGSGGGGSGRRSGSRGRRRSTGGGEDLSCFHALYLDAKRRQAKLEALTGEHMKRVSRPGSPSITARGRQSSVEPLDVRMKVNAERWAHRWQELEERRLVQEREGCTFMPNFSMGRSASAPRMRPRRSSTGGGSGGDGGPGGITSFVARSARFQAARERNMEKLMQQAQERERQVATFQPNLAARGGEAPDGYGGGGVDVFERLVRAGTEQEVNKAALKEEYLKQEREESQHFQVSFLFLFY